VAQTVRNGRWFRQTFGGLDERPSGAGVAQIWQFDGEPGFESALRSIPAVQTVMTAGVTLAGKPSLANSGPSDCSLRKIRQP